MVGFEDIYKISNQGNVVNKITHKSLSQHICNGYLRLTLSFDGNAEKWFVHRIVGVAFIPNPNNRETINHKDGNKANNNVDNLEWATRLENNQHAWNTGLVNNSGVNHPNCKLTRDEVLKIRELTKLKKYYGSNQEIASMFNVGNGTISHIRHNRSWKGV